MSAPASDLSALGQLPNLTSLSVNTNSVSDLSALVQLSNLTKLSIGATTVNLKGVNHVRNLAHIKIANAQDVDLEPLVAAISLKKIILANVTFRNSALLKSIEIEITGTSREI